MAPNPKPAAEVDIDDDLVRRLLADQHGDLADRPLRPLASGWDNVNYRLGDDLVVRLPRRELSAKLVEHEQRWLPALAPRLPLPIPAPVRAGRPAHGYPWAWSINPYFAGTIAALDPPEASHETAETIGRFLAALHRPASADAPPNPYRGGPLSDRDEPLRKNVTALGDRIDGATVLAGWEELVDVPGAAASPVWIHGDLHLGNVICDSGAIAAVVDFGDITGGDRATDLPIAWMLFERKQRATLRTAAGIDDDTWRRGLGWALHFALIYLAHSVDTPWMRVMGERLFPAVLAGMRQGV